MNTVKLGDDFEEKSYHIIEEAIKRNDLGLIPKYCKILKKPKYYSFRRKKEIVFDLSIEFTPPKATNPALIYLVECKNYSNLTKYMCYDQGGVTCGQVKLPEKLWKQRSWSNLIWTVQAKRTLIPVWVSWIIC